MKRTLSIAAAALVLTACGGGGGGSGNTLVRPQPQQRIAFAPAASGHYRTDGLPAPAAADARHMPIYRDDNRIAVGVDQAAAALRRVPAVTERGGTDIRYGTANDGVSSATLRRYLDSARETRRHSDGAGTVTNAVSWDSSATAADRARIVRAVQMINAALPESRKLAVSSTGRSIRISFLPESQYIRDYGNNWGTSVYAGGIVINRAYQSVNGRRATILLAHEIIHKFGLLHPDPRIDTIMESSREVYARRQNTPQPLSLLYPADRDFLRVSNRIDDFGPWSSTSMHIAGHGRHTAFGVALRNGYAEPWAYGLVPRTTLARGGLTGSATWSGALVGWTPGRQAVTGDARVSVDIGPLTGRADFTGLEQWSAAPGPAGTGVQFGDGDLGYTIRVTGNTFRETGGDAGRVTGIFTGRQHQGAAGTLERSDLTAAFGATR